MKHSTTPTQAYRASAAYVVAAGLWIVSSDVLLRALRPHVDPIFVEETLRNLLFAGVAALVLFGWLEALAARAGPEPGRRPGTLSRATAAALRMCIAIAVVSALWAFGANALFYLAGSNLGLMVVLVALKDAFFVAVTVPVVYFGVRHFLLAAGAGEAGIEAASMPAGDHGPEAPVRDPLWIPAQIFVLLALSIGGTGYFLFDRYKTSVRAEAEKSLTAIASLKFSQIRGWRAEHERLGLALAGDPLLADEIRQWADQRRPADARRALISSRLDALREALGLHSLVLLEPNGKPWLSASAGNGDAGHLAQAHGRDLIDEALRTRRVVFSDIHHLDPLKVSEVVIDLLVPLVAPGTSSVFAVIYGRIDPRRTLFPMIQAWPLPAVSGEALIVRREGDEVVFLNDLRHGPSAALQLRFPVKADRLLAAQAVRGREGVLEGLDYRGIESIAVTQRFPDTSWLLIAKIDAAELYAPIYERARLVAVLSLLFIACAGIAISLWWRQQRGILLLRQYEQEIRRRALMRHFDFLTRYANDIILLFDEEWRIVEANERAVASYGYGRDELIGMDAGKLNAGTPGRWFGGDEVSWTGDGTLYCAEHRRRNGSQFPVEISGRAIEVDDRIFRQAIVRDISERRRAEQQLQLDAQVFASNQEAILIADAGMLILRVNQAFTQITGFPPEDVVGRTIRTLLGEALDGRAMRDVWADVQARGHWQGELWSHRKSGEEFPLWISVSAVTGEKGQVTHYIAVFSDISERKASEEQIRYLAHHDALTGLPNRVLMRDRLDQAIAHARRTERQVAVLMLDLDRFKNINDSLGHAAGDLLLKSVAERLRACLRRSDTVSRPEDATDAGVSTVSRQGGDEFVIVASVLRKGEDAGRVAAKVLEAASGTYPLEDQQVFVTASIGISEFPGDGEDADTLIRNADVAMYHAKESGRGNFQFFAGSMTERAQERLALENDLRRALTRVEFVMHYQPQIDVATGALTGAEALVRWNHPDLGMVPPAKFIPVAEDSGLIVELGERLLRFACEQARAWQSECARRLAVAVNVSAAQFHDRNFVAMVEAVLAASGLDPQLLELELTEGVVMRHGADTVRILRHLKSLGVMLAIDDFGTGYSSLSYLKRFPIDRLKIDQSFVRDIPSDGSDVEIVKAIIALGRSLDLNVIAEGVETQEQLDFLRDQHCDAVQGYFIGRPISGEEFARTFLAGADRANGGAADTQPTCSNS